MQDPDAITAIFDNFEVNTIRQTYWFVKCSSRPVASKAAKRWSFEGMDTDWDVMAATDSKQLSIHEREVRFRMNPPVRGGCPVSVGCFNNSVVKIGYIKFSITVPSYAVLCTEVRRNTSEA